MTDEAQPAAGGPRRLEITGAEGLLDLTDGAARVRRADEPSPMASLSAMLDLGVEVAPAKATGRRDQDQPGDTTAAAGPAGKRSALGNGIVIGALVLAMFAAGAVVVRGRQSSLASAHGPVDIDGRSTPAPGAESVVATGIDAYRGAGWIARENARPGTTAWQVSADPASWDKIRGYADRTSVDWKHPFALYATDRGGPWHAEAYRVGWYGGTGGRLIWTSPTQAGHAQPPPERDASTGRRETHWTKSLDVTPDDGWPPGQYLIKLVSDDGGGSFVPIVIRDDASTAPLLVQSAVTTWQAYNDWGGASLYNGADGDPDLRADVVSFDRPYGGNGSGEFFGREYEFINWAERSGYDVTYWTDIDLHQHPQLALQHRAVVTLGHDEYYSPAMRTGLETARDQGVNLAFFGANAVFRKIRFEASDLGPDRRQVNYRTTADPMGRTDPSQVTVSWREAPSNDPESALVGSYYECNPVSADLVIADPSAWMFEGSGFAKGDKVTGVVGNEYDRVTPEAPTPSGIQVLTHSPVTCRGTRSFADSTWYAAPSGAGVWASGTLWWERFLQKECPTDHVGDDPVCKLQKMTATIIEAMAAGPAGAAHPPRSNLGELGIRAGATTPGTTRSTTTTTRPRSTTTTRPRTTTTSSVKGATTTTRAPTTTTAPTTSTAPG